MTNPLQKYFRQPKVFVALPSRGLYYPEGSFHGDPTNVPLMGMTGMDEILIKTPDALLNGEATVKVIESCCPYIKDGWAVPSIDLDTILIGIRIATYGDVMTVDHVCEKCNAENIYELDLKILIDHFNNLKFENILRFDPIEIRFKPLNYKQMTESSLKNFGIRRTLYQAMSITEEIDQQKIVDKAYSDMADIKAEMIINKIESVQTIENLVEDADHISEWIKNSDRSLFTAINNFFEKSQEEWDLPKQNVSCNECGHQDVISVSMDQSNFFVQAS